MTAPPPTTNGHALVDATGLTKHFPMRRHGFGKRPGVIKAVDGIDLSINGGETLGLVGETGCGKSTTGRLLTKLIDPSSGRVTFDGQDITALTPMQMRPLRHDMQLIFQDPFASLNPRYTVGSILSAPFHLQKITPEGGVRTAVHELLRLVGLNPEHYNRYPYEFSGGQRQRIGIARALALRPKFLVCDEPVSALDVSVQAQILNLLSDLQRDIGLTYLFIAHDLSVVRHVCDRVGVMYLGKIVELAPRAELYQRPMHPYTHALLSAVPIPDPQTEGTRERILLQGDVPSPINPPTACKFHTRCWKAQDICRTVEPPLAELRPRHRVACHFPEQTKTPE